MAESSTIHGDEVFAKLLPSVTFYAVELMDLEGHVIRGGRLSCWHTEMCAITYATRASEMLAPVLTGMKDDPATVRVCKYRTVPGCDIQTLIERAVAGDLGAFCEEPKVVAEYAITR